MQQLIALKNCVTVGTLSQSASVLVGQRDKYSLVRGERYVFGRLQFNKTLPL